MYTLVTTFTAFSFHFCDKPETFVCVCFFHICHFWIFLYRISPHQQNKYVLFTGWEVRIGRNGAASGGTQTEGTVSPNRDRPRPMNNIFIFLQMRFNSFRIIFLLSPTYVC